MLGEDSQDTWACEDTFPAKTFRRAKTRGRPKTLPEHTALAKKLLGVKKCACQTTPAEDRSGEGTRCYENTWVHADKTGRAKTRVVTKTHGHARSLGEDTRRREDRRARTHCRYVRHDVFWLFSGACNRLYKLVRRQLDSCLLQGTLWLKAPLSSEARLWQFMV